MTQEIVEAVRDIEREKGIESGTLVAALEDALLAAYKKMPGSARHAIVEIDDQGDFRVFAVELPADRPCRRDADVSSRVVQQRCEGAAHVRAGIHQRFERPRGGGAHERVGMREL